MRRGGDLVGYLDDEEYALLLAATEQVSAKAGDVVLHKGSPARSLILVEEGEVEIVEEVAGGEIEIVLDRAGAGEVVGEVGFLDGRPRLNQVRAKTEVRLRRLTREALLRLAEKSPGVFTKLVIALAELMAVRFRSAVSELSPVRAYAAAQAAGAGGGDVVFDEIDEPLPELAGPDAMIREVAKKIGKDLAGL